MTALEHFRGLLAYEAVANAKVAASLESIPPQRQAEPAAARARGIFAHIQSARHVWLSRVGGTPARAWVMFPDWTPAQSLEDACRLDAEWHRWMGMLGDGDMDRQVTYRSTEGAGYVSTIGEILTHVFNHSTYHRGQVALLVAQCGGQPAATDAILFSRKRTE